MLQRFWGELSRAGILLTMLSACSGGSDPTPTPTPTPEPTPMPTPYAGPVTDMTSYMQACEAELGPFPTFNCYEGVQIPITVTDPTGQTTVEATTSLQLEEGVSCDKPSRLSACVPYSRVGVKSNERGSVFTFICRLYEERQPLGATATGEPLIQFEDLGVIGHNPNTGATCFWAVPIDGTLFDGTVIPRPGSPEDETFFETRGFWYTLPQLAGSGCMTCHDNDPYIHDPWVEQMGIVPHHPLTDYRAVARDSLNTLGEVDDWSPARYLQKPEAAPCLSCHRLADRFTCRSLVQDATGDKIRAMPTTEWVSNHYPDSHWMSSFDPQILASWYPTESDWDATFSRAVDAVQECCGVNPPKDCWGE